MPGSSRWLTTPRRTPARIERTCSCFSGGKNSMIRPIDSAASIVCRVERTRWPDSAACSAVCAVAASRSSPITVRDGTEGERDRPALPEAVDAEPRQVGGGVREVEVARRVEGRPPGGILRGHGRQHALELLLVERRPPFERREGALAAEDRRLADLQMDVACTALDGAQKDRVEIHPSLIGSGVPLLYRRRGELRWPCGPEQRSPSAAGAKALGPRPGP